MRTLTSLRTLISLRTLTLTSILITSVLIAYFSFRSSDSDSQENGKTKDVPPPVVTTQVAEPQRVAQMLTFPARIESKINARILAESDGVVQRIVAPLGSKVRRGSGLLVIKNVEGGFSYAPLTVTSPVTGTVSQVKVTVGSQVARGQELAIVTDPSQLRLAVEVSASDLPAMKVGMQGEFTASVLEQSVAVRLVGLSPWVDPSTGTATAELTVDPSQSKKTDPTKSDLVSNSLVSPITKSAATVVTKGTKDISLVPGTLGQVRFEINPHQAFVLPDFAIVYKGNVTFVRIVVDGKANRVPVKLGPKQRGQFEVIEGLKKGDVVVEHTSAYIADGAAVQIQPSTPPPAEAPAKTADASGPAEKKTKVN